MKRLREIRKAITLERLLPLAIIGGALILIGSEFADTFRLEAPGDTTLGLEEASERHSWAILVLGLFTLAAVTFAVVAGSKPAATATAMFGAAALLLFLLIDLPDAGKVSTFDSPNNPFVQTKAEPEEASGFFSSGSLVVAVCGVALATLSSEQLRSLRPGSRPARPGQSGEGGREGQARGPALGPASSGGQRLTRRRARRSGEGRQPEEARASQRERKAAEGTTGQAGGLRSGSTSGSGRTPCSPGPCGRCRPCA